jgi:hypothetical protein
LDDIGAGHIPSFSLQQLDYSPLAKTVKQGVIFCTYSSLIAVKRNKKGGGGSGGAVTRLQQLVAWMGGAGADGCILFDECHKAKNLGVDPDKGTKTGQAVSQLVS